MRQESHTPCTQHTLISKVTRAFFCKAKRHFQGSTHLCRRVNNSSTRIIKVGKHRTFQLDFISFVPSGLFKSSRAQESLACISSPFPSLHTCLNLYKRGWVYLAFFVHYQLSRKQNPKLRHILLASWSKGFHCPTLTEAVFVGNLVGCGWSVGWLAGVCLFACLF